MELPGLLSQTVSPSSTVRWILPARIRTKSQNDVVFVGENSVQIREALSNGYLSEVIASLTLGARILAAKVVSAKLELIPIIEHVLDQRRDYERERYTINDREVDDETPPQVVILTLATNELVFLFARDLPLGKTKFIWASKPFPRDVSLAERFGSQIAVDPLSRAIAIAPAMGRLGVFALKNLDEIQNEIREVEANSSHIFDPIRQDRYLKINGLILKMDFLPSSKADANKVMLLILVAQQGSTVMFLYTWDDRAGPRTARPGQCSGQIIQTQGSMPLLLIPSSRCLSFIVVFETEITVWENLLAETATYKTFPNPEAGHSNTRAESASSASQLLWVQWAKPRRHAKYLEKHDNFYLVREDGQLRYFVVDYDLPRRLAHQDDPGSLEVNVDQAFATVAAPAELGADVFLVAGDMCDGGVWHCEARKKPVCVQSLPNMAPVCDVITIKPEHRFTAGKMSSHHEPERLFITCGSVPKCSYVNEIRFGLNSKIAWEIEHQEAFSATNLWLLNDTRPERALLLMSHPLLTTIISIDPLGGEVSAGDVIAYPGIDTESSTLAAACTPQGLTIQITQNSINSCVLSRGPRRASKPHEGAICCVAAIDAASGNFVVGYSSVQGFHLLMGAANMDMEIQMGSSQFDLPQEPTALAIIFLGDFHVVVAGLSDGTLLALRADDNNNLHKSSTHNVQGFVGDDQSYTVSSVEILTQAKTHQSLVLCGLKTGILILWSLTPNRSDETLYLDLQFIDKTVLGSTRIGIAKEQKSSSHSRGALILCESALRRISLLDGSGLQYHVSRIWMPKEENDPKSTHQPRSRLHPEINIAARSFDDPTAGILFCVTNSGILVSSLQEKDTAVLQRHRISGAPEKMTYSQHIKKLVVATDQVELVAGGGARLDKYRRCGPALELVDPNACDDSQRVPENNSILMIGEQADRVRALAEWRPANKITHFEFMVVGIESDAPDHRLPSGKIVCINLKDAETLPFSALNINFSRRYLRRPVHCVQPYDWSSLLIGAGNDIILETLDMKTRTLSTIFTFALPSSATSLSLSNSLIYATTQKHSLIVLQRTADSLEVIASDTIARNLQNALVLPDNLALLSTITGEGTSLVCLQLNPTENMRSSFSKPLFEARLPLVLESIHQTTPPGSSRLSYHAITMDGTIYRFQTITHKEWALLHFLEQLFREPDLVSEMRRLVPFANREKSPSTRPVDMHVDGDLLARIVEFGPRELRHSLVKGRRRGQRLESPEVKSEQQVELRRKFEELAEGVVGKRRDLAVEVVKFDIKVSPQQANTPCPYTVATSEALPPISLPTGVGLGTSFLSTKASKNKEAAILAIGIRALETAAARDVTTKQQEAGGSPSITQRTGPLDTRQEIQTRLLQDKWKRLREEAVAVAADAAGGSDQLPKRVRGAAEEGETPVFVGSRTGLAKRVARLEEQMEEELSVEESEQARHLRKRLLLNLMERERLLGLFARLKDLGKAGGGERGGEMRRGGSRRA